MTPESEGSAQFLRAYYNALRDKRGDKKNMLTVGTKAPAFRLPDQNGTMHELKDFKGRKVILYFYPKDSTAGCTKEACSFRDAYPDITEKGAVVIGISKDSAASHRKFAEKNALPFLLLADEDTSVIQAYDAWKEKKLYGRAYMGTVRCTYLIDETGTIIKAYEKVKPADHGAETLGDL